MFNPEKWPIAPIIERADKTREKQELKKKEISKEQTEEKKEWLFEPRIGDVSFEDKLMAEKRLDNLGRLMKGADFDWWLDGGLNISIYKGDYCRSHKDIDMSVNQEDIEKLHFWAKERGYNLFDTTSHENPKKLSSEDLKEMKEYKHLVLSDAEKYKRHAEREIEMNVHKTDEEGNQIVEGVKISKKYFENLPKYKTTSGYEVNLSHPVVVAFHKLKIERGDFLEPLEEQLKDIRKSYDIEDLKRLRERLSDEDIKALKILVTEQNNKGNEVIDERLEEIFNSLDLKTPESEILRVFEEKAGFKDEPEEISPKTREAIKKICSYIAKNRDLSFDDFSAKFKEIVDFEEYMSRTGKRLEMIKKERGHKEIELPDKIKNLLSEKEKIRYDNFEEEKKEKEKILEAVKEIYTNAQEAKVKLERKEITINKAKSEVKEKAVANPMIAEYSSAHVDEIVDIAFESETEEEYIRVLTEKYGDKVRKKIEEKFSSKRGLEKEKEVEEEKAEPKEKKKVF